MTHRTSPFLILIAGLLLCCTSLYSLGQEPQQKIARVFLLVGQSNMQGQAVVDLDHPQHYNGGKGTLVQALTKKQNRRNMGHLRDESGKWTVRDDVFCWYRTDEELKTGGLTIGFTGYGGEPHHFGPELQFGHIMGDLFEEPVLLIKTAWGGKSLNVDFRPPGAGGEVGPFFIKMLEQIGEAMERAPEKMPELKNHKLVISGLVWQQGWNDMVDDEAIANYEKNLKHFIKDMRKQVGIDDLPVVIGELGNDGPNANERIQRFRKAQSAIIKLNDTQIAFIKTAHCARPAKQSPNTSHGHHWYGNAESYFYLGDALGLGMKDLIQSRGKKRVLILGDSISIGYTPFVQQMLADTFVTRPMRGRGAENCQGTDYGIANIDRWLKMKGGNWDVIHFNFGLHDLKHVDAETGKNSMKPEDPLQSSPEEYETQLREIVSKLKATNAKLIFCTTTPVPEGVKPLRETSAPGVYNEIGIRIAKENGIAVNDLYSFAEERIDQIQMPANVHFSRDGSKTLAEKVAESIKSSLNQN